MRYDHRIHEARRHPASGDAAVAAVGPAAAAAPKGETAR